MHRLWRLLWPCGVLAIAAAAMAQLGLASRVPAPALAGFELLAAVASFLLAWRFGRTRALYALAVLLLADLFANRWTSTSQAFSQDVFALVSILLPLNFLLLCFHRERGLFNLIGATKLLFLVVQLSLANYLLLDLYPESSGWLNHTWFDAWPSLLDPIPQTSALLFGLALATSLMRMLRRQTPVESSLFWALALALFALLTQQPGPGLGFSLSAAIVVLATGLHSAFHTPAFVDELTGLPGKRALDEALRKQGAHYTLALADLDQFQKFNDRHGREAGDQALRMTASRLSSDKSCQAFRIYGDRFVLLYASLAPEDAMPSARSACARIAERPFILRSWRRPRNRPDRIAARRGKLHPVEVSVSIGLAAPSPERAHPDHVLAAAEKAAERAKKRGRNRVQQADPCV